jgi:hypothetical protein
MLYRMRSIDICNQLVDEEAFPKKSQGAIKADVPAFFVCGQAEKG